ncbi:MAG: trigger factor [Firmicutes bacterium]|nr:trigger factor [Bacillota bacterium]
MAKKLIALCTMLALVLSMTACGSSSDKPYDYDLSEYVTLGDYIGVEVERVDPIEVTDETVDGEIMIRLEENTSTETYTEGTVEDGTTVNIDYVGKIDGVEFEGGSAAGFDLILGSGLFIDGFESGLVGKTVGETVVLDLKFPEDYGNEELNGKDVEFTVTINSYSKEIIPDLNEEFVKSVSDCTTVEEYKALVKSELEAQAKELAEQEMMAAAWEAVYNNATILKYPEEELAEKEAEMKEYYEQYSQSYGMELADFLQMAGLTEEEFNEEAKMYAETSVAEEMIMYSIARAEGLTISDEEYQTGAAEYAENLGFEDIAALEEYYTKEMIEDSLLWDKFFDFILENAKIVEPKADVEENTEESVENTEE